MRDFDWINKINNGEYQKLLDIARKIQKKSFDLHSKIGDALSKEFIEDLCSNALDLVQTIVKFKNETNINVKELNYGQINNCKNTIKTKIEQIEKQNLKEGITYNKTTGIQFTRLKNLNSKLEKEITRTREFFRSDLLEVRNQNRFK